MASGEIALGDPAPPLCLLEAGTARLNPPGVDEPDAGYSLGRQVPAALADPDYQG